MKKTLSILFGFILFQGFGQTTSIPDPNFETALIDLGYDIIHDGSVQTANISGITSLDVSFYNISNLSGIQAFSSLTHLYCHYNNLTTLSVSGLTNLQLLQASYNQLSMLSTANCPSLYEVRINNNNLSSLNVTQLPGLIHLSCENNNLSMLNLANCTTLQSLNCSNNNLLCLNIKTGNYNLYGSFLANGNPYLTCIEFHDPSWATTNLTAIPAQASYSTYCNNSCTTGISEPGPADKELIKVVNLMGQETELSPNTPLIYIYSDGSTEKVFYVK